MMARHTRMKAWDYFWDEQGYVSGAAISPDEMSTDQHAFCDAANSLANARNLTTDQIYAINNLARAAYRLGREQNARLQQN